VTGAGSVVNTLPYGAEKESDVGVEKSVEAVGNRLGPSAWVDAALLALADGGVAAVKVERLAEALGVTKGSFYWHFPDRQALLAATVMAWKQTATDAIISKVEAGGGDAVARLHRLFSIVLKADGRLDSAVRSWAANDPQARSVLAEVDESRTGYLEVLFLDMGFSRQDAIPRAAFVYQSLIGSFAMGRAPPQATQLDGIINVVLPMLVRQP
jgi:AcrR family transcriptional regulator